ncbi:YigZ family protein [Lentilactobacillus senioris]|uniref:YigZ family protein n=1 Tax=Lentilactobacillus senioris TaxID=931534 RepID=UPI003D270A0F
MPMSFLTIATTGKYEEIIKKSRFICHLAPVETEDEAKAIIAQVVADNPKANHNCYAYLLGDTDQIQRASDNGEPSGTAGVPILEVLKKNQLHNVVAVITRYFGGIKLGAGGLIRAYSGTTAAAVETIGIVELVDFQLLDIQIEYSQLDSLNYFLTTQNINIENTEYGSQVKITIAVRISEQAKIISDLTDLLNGKLTVTKAPIKPVAVAYEKDK